jgi:major membrane immunogen (membrane-anchored lipoprotein)
MKIRKLVVCVIISAALALLGACSGSGSAMRDGYYMAEGASFDARGWKEFVIIYVNDDRILTVEYNARNESGFPKSWDIEYMRVMNNRCGTYPDKYTREYALELLSRQNPEEVDAVSGATQSHESFKLLSAAAMARARAGDKDIAFVELPEEHQ